MEIEKGQIVQSRAGRDNTHCYVVVEVQADRVLLADGGKWTKEKPKAKNRRHINPTKTILAPEKTEDDSQIKVALAAFCQHAAATTGG